MAFDFGAISLPEPDDRVVPPVDLFRTLRVSDPDVNDLWLAQGDALREWHDARAESDVAIALNTGAGKTLVGLLIAQSLANETRGRVLYACSSIQLVEQTAEKARLYGLDVTTYIRGTYSDSRFHEGLAPCVTTYQAIFNGRARRIHEDVEAIVFDDAHAAGHILRDQFTLTVDRERHAGGYAKLSALYRDYFEVIGKGTGYEETISGVGSGDVWLIPPSEVRTSFAQFRQALLELTPPEDERMRFPWGHLRDHLDLCAVVVTGQSVSVSPPFLPLSGLPSFSAGVRRVYLSATLQAADGFARAFGRTPTRVVAPPTTAGECERLILLPKLSQMPAEASDVSVAREVIQDRKALIIVPSEYRRRTWDDVSTEGDLAAEDAVRRFREKTGAACLVLAARYDGMDLPGDTCRVLVIDDLPSGLSPLERFLWEQLGQTKLLRSTVASRVVQSLGRISRGMSDYGVVVITGDRLVDWLSRKVNQALLPPFLQQQLSVGRQISRSASATTLPSAAAQCLSRDQGWLRYYDSGMKAATVESALDDVTDSLEIALAEAAFIRHLWARQYQEAASALEARLDAAFQHSSAAGAWHAFWLGYTYSLLGREDVADEYYRRACTAKLALPRRREELAGNGSSTTSQQVLNICDLLTARGRVQFPRSYDTDISALTATATPRRVEAALEALGTYLGLDSSRPDNDRGTGPDVLWRLPMDLHLSIEAKTGKSVDSQYTKDEQGQLRDHLRWVQTEFGDVATVKSAFVGPFLPASPDSNPEDWMDVIELSAFADLAERLRILFREAADGATRSNLTEVVQAALQRLELDWPNVANELGSRRLMEL